MLDKELTVERIDDEIRISIGLATLAYAIENGPNWYEEYSIDPGFYKDYMEFGKSIVQYLEHEEEDGSTPVHRLFDSVAEEALNQGAEGFNEKSGEF